MTVRGVAKRLVFGSLPYMRGRFPYYGHTVHFPLGSITFERACAEGIYERDTTGLILALAEPETTYFDVGANIGLLSLPVLALRPGVKVVSIEPSPTTLPFLKKTHAAASHEDWTVVGSAVGASSGEAEFWAGDAAWSAFDGLRCTGRGGSKQPLRVPIQTLDEIWQQLGSPPVSIIKMDIEGAEHLAIQGAKQIISSMSPTFVLEWFELNLRPYGINSDYLLELSAQFDYGIYASPSLVPVKSKLMLKALMAQTETFVLAPRR